MEPVATTTSAGYFEAQYSDLPFAAEKRHTTYVGRSNHLHRSVMPLERLQAILGHNALEN